MRYLNGRRALAILLAGALIAVGFRLFGGPLLSYILDTRGQLISLKLHGHAPDVSWIALARRMGPRWMQSASPVFARAVESGAPPCAVRWRTPLGDFWASATDGRVLDHLIMEELGGRIYDRAPAGLRAGDVALDVGAHLGTFTRYALSRGASRVIAIEPVPALADCLERTFAPEIARGTVSVLRVAAWERNEELSFGTGRESTMGHVDAQGGGELRVSGRTIDSLVDELGVDTVHFIKMDIEGSEASALRGAAATIRSSHPRMAICIYHGADDVRAVPAAVRAASGDYDVTFRSGWQAYFHRP